MVDEGITDEELDGVKQRARANFIRGLRGNAGMASQLAWYQTYTGDWRNLFDEVERIEAVTLEDVKRVAAEIFAENNRTVAIIETERTPRSPSRPPERDVERNVNMTANEPQDGCAAPGARLVVAGLPADGRRQEALGEDRDPRAERDRDARLRAGRAGQRHDPLPGRGPRVSPGRAVSATIASGSIYEPADKIGLAEHDRHA